MIRVKLAQLAAMKQLPTVHVPPPVVRQRRSILQYRRNLIARRLVRRQLEFPVASSGNATSVPARAPLRQAHRSILGADHGPGVGPSWAPITTLGGRVPPQGHYGRFSHHRETESSPAALRVHDHLNTFASDERFFREDKPACGGSAPHLHAPLQGS